MPVDTREPIDITDVDVDTHSRMLLEAIDKANADDPRVFARRGGLARVIDADEGPVLQPLTDRLLMFEAERVVRWQHYKGNGSHRRLAACPAHPAIVYHVGDAGHWPILPKLDALLSSPVILPDGRILTGVGYDAASQLYMAVSPQLAMPPVPLDPTEDDCHLASLGIQDFASEYRFATDEDRANALGMWMAHVLRPLMGISAHLPIFVVDAPTAGSGKGLLINVASIIAQGTEAFVQVLSKSSESEAEIRKMITSVLLAGRQFVHFDNMAVPLDSPAISALLTTDLWTDRGLGGNIHLGLPVTTTFAASGNNIRVGGDNGRRVVAIRIDTGSAMPFLRTFRRMDLLGEVRQARGQILSWILTLARRWVQQGMPNPTPRVIMGSFQPVVDVIGGVLRVAEIGGWMGNLLRFAEADNQELQEWTRFIHAWYGRWGDQPQYAKDVAEACNDTRDSSLRDALPDNVRPYGDIEKAKLGASLGNFLKARVDQIFDGLQLLHGGQDRNKVMRWRVVPVATEPAPAPPPAPETPPEDPINARAHVKASAGAAGSAGAEKRQLSLLEIEEPKKLPRARLPKTAPAAPAAPAQTHTLTHARGFATRAYAHARVSVDTETTGLHAWETSTRIRTLQVAVGGEVQVYDLWTEPEILEIWRPILEGHGPNVVYHNAKFDLAMLRASGLHLPPWQKVDDTYLASVLLDNAATRRPPQTLKALAARHLERDLPKEMQKSDWSGELTQEQVDYAGEDARATLDLAEVLLPRIDAEELRGAYDIERAILPIIVELGLRGVRIDPELWAPLAANAERHLASAELVLKQLAGESFNPRSWQQIQAVLEERGISIPSTRESYLQEHAGDAFVDALLGYREWQKGVTTYGMSVLRALDDDQRFHADYNQADTRTGRMTADIIHQMPKAGGYREAVRPIDGRCLIKADYKQLQVVIVADLAEARSMIDAFNAGRDIHTETVQRVLGSPHPTPEQRQAAKALNFGLLFGGGAETLQRHARAEYQVDWSLEEAQALRKRFFEEYPEIKRWHYNRPGVIRHEWPERDEDEPVDLCTDSGRRRLAVSKYTEKHNSPVQMMEVDGVKTGLKLLDDELKASGLDAQIVMVVHDEVDLESSLADAEAVKAMAKRCLEEGMNRWLLHTRAVIDVDITRDWHGTKLL